MTKSLRILLVEDHLDTQRLMSRVLQSFKHDVKAADSVRTALALASEHPFDLVISDLGLPDGSGIQLMRELQQKHGLKGIALSGFAADDEVHGNVEGTGFIAHLTKPISFDQLQETITRLTN
jgi:CheY-like chemotaxis protein